MPRGIFHISRLSTVHSRLLNLLVNPPFGLRRLFTKTVILLIPTGSVSVDLICVQKRMDNSGVLRGTTIPDYWAPSLWIKAVTRDSTRLNSAWRGDATQAAACLYRQTEELVSTASWYQRGQPPDWIQVLVHWLPSKNQDISQLDSDLVERLTRVLRVPILLHTEPWYPGTQLASLAPTITPAHSPPLSVRKYLVAATRFRRQMCTKLLDLDCATTDDRAVLVRRFTYFLNYVETDVDSELLLDECEEKQHPVIRTPLDAVLRRACVVPFGSLTPDQFISPCMPNSSKYISQHPHYRCWFRRMDTGHTPIDSPCHSS
ncbi:hypothetical protein CRM22_004824 [Opisthorchis felineus]|uniref:Uncharacterized protein n=1 Tax=Opisthorchis felineus TaxID=147828 RepID=A0A4V3SF79_OPIFE|nr:hypothetical protein CRM22_004824 [Opisthorchis felineus]